MKFLHLLFWSITFVECAFSSGTIDKPEDLFGKTILPEQEVNSEYGTLRFNKIVVPDFSCKKDDFELLSANFNGIKKIVSTNDLLEKYDVAMRLVKSVMPKDYQGYLLGYKGYSMIYKLVQDVILSAVCRTIESYTSCNAIFAFKAHESLITRAVDNNYLDGLISYNGQAVDIIEFCQTMVYMTCLDYWSKRFSDPKDADYYVKRRGGFLNSLLIGIKCEDVPKNNFFSWSLYKSKQDTDLIKFIHNYLETSHYDKRTLVRDIIQRWMIQFWRQETSELICADTSDFQQFVKLKYFQNLSRK
ncbi:MAG: hypothetical protein II670_05135 [Alphaproteobacteria bacterium]|nr:hypothetical protein [Alphaproteobacteria bacterium]